MRKELILLIISLTLISAGTIVNAQQTNDTLKSAIQKQSPHIIISGLKRGHITKDSLLNADSLFCAEKGTKITSFRMTSNSRGDLVSFKSNNNKFTPDMKKMIKRMTAGDHLYFEDIVVKMPDGAIVKISAINIKIK
jgi:hypothetical protein